jgi:hypothetical protein
MSEPQLPTAPPAQRYADPTKPETLRYWDGERWTEHTAPGPGPRPAKAQELGTAALWLAVALAVLSLLTAVFSAEGERNLIHDAATDSISFGMYDVVSLINLPVVIATYIVTCMWLYRCRTNVDLLRPNAKQKRRAGWVWFGWLTPFVAAWFPFQIVRDIGTRARSEGRPAEGPPSLGLWWMFWLISNVINNIDVPIALSEDVELMRYTAEVDVAAAFAAAAGAIFWVRIIRYIQGDQMELLRRA